MRDIKFRVWDKKVKDWSDDEAGAVRTVITENFKVEGVLKSEVQLSIKRLMDIGCYRGLRHRKGLPLREFNNPDVELS